MGKHMTPLSIRLADWTDWDVAEWHLAIVLGLWDDEGNPPGQDKPTDSWGGHKGIIWSNNSLGNALATMLITLTDAGVLEEENQRYRWAHHD
jgi:hypothetical protein